MPTPDGLGRYTKTNEATLSACRECGSIVSTAQHKLHTKWHVSVLADIKRQVRESAATVETQGEIPF